MATAKRKIEKKPETETQNTESKFMQICHKIFGGLDMSWRNTIVFAIIMGIWTALMAMFVPDGNSFHDIVATAEWWVIPAIFIIVNCKKPLEAALKTFVFFLVSQPLVYLIQVPFNSMGWGLFGYYRYWFMVTLLTFPGAFIGWFIKHDKWYSGVILSVMTFLLAFTAFGYIKTFEESFPNHLISVLYCLAAIVLLIIVIFRNTEPRLVCAGITIVATLICILLTTTEAFEAYNTSFLNDIELTGKPYVSIWSGGCNGKVELIHYEEDGYSFRLVGCKGKESYFTITDDATEQKYDFKYYFDKEQNTVIVERKE